MFSFSATSQHPPRPPRHAHATPAHVTTGVAPPEHQNPAYLIDRPATCSTALGSGREALRTRPPRSTLPIVRLDPPATAWGLFFFTLLHHTSTRSAPVSLSFSCCFPFVCRTVAWTRWTVAQCRSRLNASRDGFNLLTLEKVSQNETKEREKFTIPITSSAQQRYCGTLLATHALYTTHAIASMHTHSAHTWFLSHGRARA